MYVPIHTYKARGLQCTYIPSEKVPFWCPLFKKSMVSLCCVAVFFSFSAVGKEAMRSGAGAFNKAAGQVYQSLPDSERERLKKLSAERSEETVAMTPHDIMKAGANKQVQCSNVYSQMTQSVTCAVSGVGEDRL